MSRAGSAQALSTDWGLHDPVELGAGLLNAPGRFDDTFVFSLVSGGLLLTAVSNDLQPIFDISGGLVELFMSDDTLIGSLPFDSTAVSTSFAVVPVIDYYYLRDGPGHGQRGRTISCRPRSPSPRLLRWC